MAAAVADETIYEYRTCAVTADLDEQLNRLSLAGWEYLHSENGSLDGDKWAPVGFTLFFRRPLGGVRKKPQQEVAQQSKRR